MEREEHRHFLGKSSITFSVPPLDSTFFYWECNRSALHLWREETLTTRLWSERVPKAGIMSRLIITSSLKYIPEVWTPSVTSPDPIHQHSVAIFPGQERDLSLYPGHPPLFFFFLPEIGNICTPSPLCHRGGCGVRVGAGRMPIHPCCFLFLPVAQLPASCPSARPNCPMCDAAGESSARRGSTTFIPKWRNASEGFFPFYGFVLVWFFLFCFCLRWLTVSS